MSDNECKFCSEHEAGDTLYECNGWDGGVSYDYIQDIKYCPLCGRKLGGCERMTREEAIKMLKNKTDREILEIIDKYKTESEDKR